MISGLHLSKLHTAFPSATAEAVKLLGSHSGRKSLAQWLWDALAPSIGQDAFRLIADAGHWHIKREAVDLYFRTHFSAILRAIRQLHLPGV